MDHRETAKKLIDMAADERTPENERVNAMVKAVKLIKEHDLLASPLTGILGGLNNINNDTVRAASSAFAHLTSPEFVDSMKKVVNALGSVRKSATGRRSSGGGRGGGRGR